MERNENDKVTASEWLKEKLGIKACEEPNGLLLKISKSDKKDIKDIINDKEE